LAHFSVAKPGKMAIAVPVHGALVLREVRMSRREEQTFKIVAGAVVLGAFAIAVAIAVALV
jgi:hypothetical protein